MFIAQLMVCWVDFLMVWDSPGLRMAIPNNACSTNVRFITLGKRAQCSMEFSKVYENTSG